MNIAVITNSFLPTIGGLEWKVHYLSTEYCKSGHEVTVFAQRPHFWPWQNRMPVAHRYALVYCNYPCPGWGMLGISQQLFQHAVLSRHKKSSFDIIHCHNLTRATEYGVLVKKKTGVPVVATPCGKDIQIVPELHYGDRLKKRYDRLVRNNLQNVDVVGSISSSVRDDIESLQPKAKIVDIPNGVDWESFQNTTNRPLRQQLGLEPGSILIITVGRNHNKKGYPLGLQAFAKIAPSNRNVHYAIIGRYSTELKSLVQKLQLNRQVTLIEQLPMSQMPGIFHSADIFFNPSLVEGFAQVNAQALACGLPCVLTDAPGNRDAGDHGGAIIAKTADIDSMAEALVKLTNDTGMRERLSIEAFESGKNYAWSNIARTYLEIFSDLVKANNCCSKTA
jgi:glycosyltransferase involved in cell wall biosynthesis